jgi:hypothetical protein
VAGEHVIILINARGSWECGLVRWTVGYNEC